MKVNKSSIIVKSIRMFQKNTLVVSNQMLSFERTFFFESKKILKKHKLPNKSLKTSKETIVN